MRALLGGKGANLAEMCRLGVPVPPGFTLPTTRCLAFFDADQRLDDVTLAALEEGVAFIESVSDGARFGDRTRPLLVSVRSGARDSMPGMMDSVLNLGLNRDTVAGLAEWSGDQRFALDAYRRLIQMFQRTLIVLQRVAEPAGPRVKLRGNFQNVFRWVE